MKKGFQPVVDILKESDRPWSIENGKKHARVIVDGAVVAIISREGLKNTGSNYHNTLSSIRRAVRATG